MLHTVSFMYIQCNNKNIMRFFFSCFITWLGHFIHGRFCLELSWPSYKIANQIIENWTWFSNQYFKRSVLRGNEYSCRVRFFYWFLKRLSQKISSNQFCGTNFDVYLFFLLSSAMFLHNQLLGEPPTIDDKLVAVSYYRPPIGKYLVES